MASKHGARGAAPSDAIPEGFTLPLALADALPVIFFCLSCITLGRRLASPLFIAGAVIAFCGGAGKVLWKLLLALARRDVRWLNRQMRYVMPAGFALMIAGAAIHGASLMPVLASLVRLPAVIFLIGWVACMVAMGWFAGHRRQDVARDNWMEEGVNAVGQACLLIALLL